MALPGQWHPLDRAEQGMPCEDCDELASTKMCGETDSFGSEWFYYCAQHAEVEKAKQVVAREENRETYRPCDWCKLEKLNVVPHRDFEEGLSGPVYEVCEECRIKEAEQFDE